MARAIFKVFFGIIETLVNVVLAPINLLIAGLFPSFSGLINNFNYVLNNYIGNGIRYFFSILPPTTRSMVLLYLSIMVSYYTITISVHAILKLYTVIKNIKFW